MTPRASHQQTCCGGSGASAASSDRPVRLTRAPRPSRTMEATTSTSARRGLLSCLSANSMPCLVSTSMAASTTRFDPWKPVRGKMIGAGRDQRSGSGRGQKEGARVGQKRAQREWGVVSRAGGGAHVLKCEPVGLAIRQSG